MDPGSYKSRLRDMPKGRDALATWREYGLVQDITDGVVIIAHSIGRDAQATTDDEIHCSAVPEALIEKLTVYQPVLEGGPV